MFKNVKRNISAFLVILVTLMALFSQTVNAVQHYIIATDTTFAPFEFQDADGNYIGIDMDLLKTIAEQQGFTYELKALGFNAAIQALESQQVDAVIAGMTITDARKQTFDFTDSYYESGLVFAVRQDAAMQQLADLKGKQIAVKNGTAGAMLADKLKDEYQFEIKIFEDSANMYEEVVAGNSDALIEDAPVVGYAIQNGDLPLKIVSDKLEVSQTGLAVSKNKNQALIQAFNQGLSDLKANGKYDEIVQHYIGTNTTNQTQDQNMKDFVALLHGLGNTLYVAFISVVLGLLLGSVLGLMRVQTQGVWSLIAGLYIDLVRGVPLLVLSFFIYFGIPQFTGMRFDAFVAGILTLSLNAAAYIAEIVRGGIQAVDVGQMEASRSLGFGYAKTMRKIILPQAFRLMLPSFVNQFVITLKDTSILSVIGLVELTQSGKVIIARTYQSGSTWLIVGGMYLVVITLLTRLSAKLERGK